MAPPNDPNLQKETRRHKGPLGGLALVVIFAVALIVIVFGIQVVQRGEEPGNEAAQVDGRTGDVVIENETTAPVGQESDVETPMDPPASGGGTDEGVNPTPTEPVEVPGTNTDPAAPGGQTGGTTGTGADPAAPGGQTGGTTGTGADPAAPGGQTGGTMGTAPDAAAPGGQTGDTGAGTGGGTVPGDATAPGPNSPAGLGGTQTDEGVTPTPGAAGMPGAGTGSETAAPIMPDVRLDDAAPVNPAEETPLDPVPQQ